MDFDQTRHARRRALRFAAGLLGAALVVSPSASSAGAAPQRADASTISVDGLLPSGVLPTDAVLAPVMSGAGAVAGATGGTALIGLACSNLSATTQTPVPCADPLTYGELSGLLGVLSSLTTTLTPDAAPGWTFDGWQSCPSVVGQTCVVVLSLLSPLEAPLATFKPAGGSAPDTTITATPKVTADKKTKATTASFSFKAYDTDASGKPTTTETTGATFECELTGPGRSPGFSPCTAPRSYDDLADGEYTFSVRASDDSTNTDESPATFTWTVVTTEPNTLITSGPRRWALARKATFGLAISPAGSATYRCSLDGAGRLCTGDRATVAFAAGTHTFAAQGSDSLGNEDSTAATRTFTLPVNNTDLKGKGWTKAKKKGHFLKTFSTTKKKGAVLRYRSSSIKRVALVVTKGKGYGTVKVYLGKHLLKKVNLSAKRTQKKKLVDIAGFSTARAGTVKIKVVSQSKPVVVEGLGLASR
jgi:hypothetical protein